MHLQQNDLNQSNHSEMSDHLILDSLSRRLDGNVVHQSEVISSRHINLTAITAIPILRREMSTMSANFNDNVQQLYSGILKVPLSHCLKCVII